MVEHNYEMMKNELKQADAKIAKLEKVIAKHPAARIGRIVKLVLFAGGGAVLIAAAIGFSFACLSSFFNVSNSPIGNLPILGCLPRGRRL